MGVKQPAWMGSAVQGAKEPWVQSGQACPGSAASASSGEQTHRPWVAGTSALFQNKPGALAQYSRGAIQAVPAVFQTPVEASVALAKAVLDHGNYNGKPLIDRWRAAAKQRKGSIGSLLPTMQLDVSKREFPRLFD